MQVPKRVAVLLSGGLDSSVAAFLLKKQGYDVVGITGKMFCSPSSEELIKNAKKVAAYLGIEHYVCDVSDAFQQYVIQYFQNSYKKGETPNPCIRCNKMIKWGKIFDFAFKEADVDYVATGHYANIVEKDGVFKLYPAKDEKKDQLYYLFELDQYQLSKTLFPLSGYLKAEVRTIAEKNNLPSKSSKESQDICFIQKPMTTKTYLLEQFGEKPGDIVMLTTGQIIGKHFGAHQYTIGQRKGIGVAYKSPLYVLECDVAKNIVYVGTKEELYKTSIKTDNLKFQSGVEQLEFQAKVKIRYNMQKENALVKKINDKWVFEFEKPVYAVTKGQAVVVYDKVDSHLIAGGWL